MSTLLTACSGTLIDGNVDPEPSAEPDTPPTLEERLADAPAPVRNCPEQFAQSDTCLTVGRGGTLLAIGLDDGSACVAAEFEIPNLEPPSHPETFGWYNEGNFIVEDRDVFFCQKFTRRDSSVVQVELETMTAKQVGPTDLGACRSIATYLDGAGLSWLGNDPAPSWAAYGEFLAWSSLESFANGDPPTREESPPELFYLQRSRIHRVDGDSGILYSLATSGTDHLERLDIAGTYERPRWARLEAVDLSHQVGYATGFDLLEGERFALIQRAEGLASFTNHELRWFSRESGEMLRETPVTLTDEQYDYLVRYVPTSEGEPSYEEPSLHFAGLTCNPWPEWRQLELG